MFEGKRGNVTIFIILGLIFVVSIGMYFIGRNFLIDNSLNQHILKTNNQNEQVKTYVQSCIDKVSLDGVYLIAEHGGFYNLVNDHLSTNIQGKIINSSYVAKVTKLQTGNYENDNMLASTQTMEEQVKLYIEQNLPLCTNGFSEFPQLEIKKTAPIVNVKIDEDKTTVFVNYPITINKSNTISTIEDFKPFEIPVRLGRLHQITNDMINQAFAHPDRGPNLNYIQDIEKIGVNTYYNADQQSQSMYFVLYDYESSIQKDMMMLKPGFSNRPFKFIFAIKYVDE